MGYQEVISILFCFLILYLLYRAILRIIREIKK